MTVLRYKLRDASGALVALHDRHDREDGTKTFTWRQPDGSLGLGGTPVAALPLYGIHRLTGSTTVLLVEGEKAVEALLGIGVQAVGTVTGAVATPGPGPLAELSGRRVFLWPDNDEVGRSHMQRIGESLAGIAAHVGWIDWPDGCRARRCPADPVEAEVLAAIARAVLPVAIIDVARAELRRRLEVPQVAVSGRQRARLLTRLEQLKKQHGWGDISDADYQGQRDAVRLALQDLPDDDRIRSFDAYRTRLLELPDAIAAASPARREELARVVVQQVVVRDRQVQSIDWTPLARPFFAKRQRECPQGDSNP